MSSIDDCGVTWADQDHFDRAMNYVLDHRSLDAVEYTDPPRFVEAYRKKSPKKLCIAVTATYDLGNLAVERVLQRYPSCNCILNSGMWNHVVADTTRWRQREIGVFRLSDFIGAMHYAKYWLYEPIPDGLSQAAIRRLREKRRTDWG